MSLLLLMMAFIVAACAPAASQATLVPTVPPQVAVTTTPDEAPTQVAEVLSASATPDPSPTAEQVAEVQSAPAVERAAWHSLPLVNARSGETFTLASLGGKTVLVEPMATWCPNCSRQLGNVQSALTMLDSEKFAFVALSVGENIQAADLVRYAEGSGFDMIFAIATPELMTELVNNFGRASLNPPSTPHFIIDPDGMVSSLFTGSKSADDLVQLLNEAHGA